MISFVVGTLNRYPLLTKTISSIRSEIDLVKTKYPDAICEIIMIDGGSDDGSVNWLSKQKDVITIIQHNRKLLNGRYVNLKSWGYFINLGFKIAQGKYICMLSDDCLIVPSSIVNAVTLFEMELTNQKKTGAVAFYWRNWPEQKEYWVGLTLGRKMFVNHGLFLTSAVKEVGYIDETTFNFYHADGDLSLKLWSAGYECIASPDSYIEHYYHTNTKLRSSNNALQQKDWSNYLKKWENVYSGYEGGWLRKEYDDPHKTYRKLYAYHLTRAITYLLFLKSIIRRLIGNIIRDH